MDAERDLSDRTSPPEPEPVSPARPHPSPADLERLRRLVAEFSATPVFAHILADWTGPAASMLAVEAIDVAPARYAVPAYEHGEPAAASRSY